MKKILFATVCFFSIVVAQAEKYTHPQQGAILDGRTIVKTNLTGLALRNYSISLERLLTKRISIQVGANVMPEGKFPIDLGKHIKDQANLVNALNSIQIKSQSITPELRLYLGTGYGKGFYLAPYYRFERLSISGLKIENTAGTNFPMTLSTDLNYHAFGLALGAQHFIGKNIVINWMLGAHYTPENKTTLKGVLAGGEAWKDSEEIKKFGAEVKELLDDFSKVFPLKDRTAKFSDDYKTAEFSGKHPFGFIRANISLGFRF